MILRLTISVQDGMHKVIHIEVERFGVGYRDPGDCFGLCDEK
jgi:hypothetical protein